jgi:hypothetical protein
MVEWSKIRRERAGMSVNRILPNQTHTPLLRLNTTPSLSNMDAPQRTTSTDRLVAELRQSNDAKWERLKDLYERASRLADSGEDGEVRNTSSAAQRLQGELDYLPRTRWARESEEMVHKIERELAIKAIEPDCNSSAEDTTDFIVEDLWNSEIVCSYKNTKQVNSVLRREIEREREILRRLKDFRDETKEIHAELVEENRKLQHESQVSSQFAGLNGLNQSAGASPDVDSLNQMLHSDLLYLAERVVSQLSTDNSDTDDEGRDQETWTLDYLVLRLVSLLVRRDLSAGPGSETGPYNARMADLEAIEDCGADAMSVLSSDSTSSGAPYLSIDDHPVRTEHVELLLNCCIVETHREDENLIRLVDYRCLAALRY